MFHPNDTNQVDADDTILFACAAYGYPTPSITWNRASSTFISRTTISREDVTVYGITYTVSTLRICRIEESDTDEYSCIAGNGVSSASSSFALTVHTTKGKGITQL